MRGGLFRNKKGQVTVFIIIAIVIVVFGVAIYFLFPNVVTNDIPLEENPRLYIQSCVEDTLIQNVQVVGLQGGSMEPSAFHNYYGEHIEYLCYTNEYYMPCIIQRSSLPSHIEDELKKSIEQKVDECFDSMKSAYESKGYSVTEKRGNHLVSLLPGKVFVQINNSLKITRDSTENYDFFNVIIDNNIYELSTIARSILAWEKAYGDSDVQTYMNFYPHLTVEKKRESDGTKVYIITNNADGFKFQFASRSVVWPPGITLGTFPEEIAPGVYIITI